MPTGWSIHVAIHLQYHIIHADLSLGGDTQDKQDVFMHMCRYNRSLYVGIKTNLIGHKSTRKNVAEEKTICSFDEAYDERRKAGNTSSRDTLIRSMNNSQSMEPAPFQLNTDSSNQILDHKLIQPQASKLPRNQQTVPNLYCEQDNSKAYWERYVQFYTGHPNNV